MKSFRTFLEATTHDQRHALQHYSWEGHADLNKYHHTHKLVRLFKRHPSKVQDKHISDAIKGQKTEEDQTVWRNVPHQGHKALHHIAKKGSGTLESKGYMSTSKKESVAHAFGYVANPKHRHILKIHVPKGSHAADMRKSGTINDSEAEVLLHKGAKLHVHKVEKTEHHTTYHANLVHDGVK